jgi:small subunit ribosomal protein S1
VEDITEILQVGQPLELTVKRIDWDNNKFSFSLRDTLADPWSKVGTTYQVGGQYSGRVSRLAPFGAFITLAEGIDGLLHISRMGDDGQRVRHPQDLFKVGQDVAVVIETIDQAEKRIGLALAGQAATAETSYTEVPASSSLGSLGELFKAGRQKKERRNRR